MIAATYVLLGKPVVNIEQRHARVLVQNEADGDNNTRFPKREHHSYLCFVALAHSTRHLRGHHCAAATLLRQSPYYTVSSTIIEIRHCSTALYTTMGGAMKNICVYLYSSLPLCRRRPAAFSKIAAPRYLSSSHHTRQGPVVRPA